MIQALILGNIITMDEKRPFAKAAVAKDGVFAYIGNPEEAKKLISKGTRVLDYGDNYIYPGFMGSHCHLVDVDKNGEPDGYICEGPVFETAAKFPATIEDIKDYLLAWQDFALSCGFTAVGDAGANIVHKDAPKAYHELEMDGLLKLRTYAYIYVNDNVDSPKAEIASIAAQREEISGEYFHIIGVKPFYDAGANEVFHSDYPVSTMMNVKYRIYTAEKRPNPAGLFGDSPRGMKEAITREQSLKAMTTNVARQFQQEHRMGSIEFGKIANMTVFDCDFLHDDIEKVAQANIIATIVDGEEVFKA